MHLVKDIIKSCAEVVNKKELIRKFDRNQSLRNSTFKAPCPSPNWVIATKKSTPQEAPQELYKMPCT